MTYESPYYELMFLLSSLHISSFFSLNWICGKICKAVRTWLVRLISLAAATDYLHPGPGKAKSLKIWKSDVLKIRYYRYFFMQ